MTLTSAPNKLWLPDLGIEIDRPWFLPNEETLREQHKILTSIFYLVKQGDTFGERLPCVRCQRRHDYITLNCIEQPFTGMFGGLYAYYRLVRDNQLERSLNAGARARYRQIVSMLGSTPDLSTVHPQLARKLMTDLGLTDAKMGAVSLGVLEGISAKTAHVLEDRINDVGIKPRFKLAVPQSYETYRAVDLVRNYNDIKVHWTR